MPRDRHLFGPGPKRLLALDGGGVRGAISLGFLEKIESLLRERQGKARLGDWFDLIGGTSTGAIIAGGLALGHSIEQLADFYRNRAHRVFQSSIRRIPGLRARFDATRLSEEIERVVGDRTLDSPELITGLALVTKRLDTGSPWWVIANNPKAPYWDTRPGHSYVGNRNYRLANLVRASTAAPFYFDPEVITIHEEEPTGLFIDGGVTPHNNPSFLLFMMVTLKAYGISWQMGPDNLTVVSVGTGSYRRKLLESQLGFMRSATLAYHALSSMMSSSQSHILELMQWLGKSPIPWEIDREVEVLNGESPLGGPLFNFVRYDVRLERDWLRTNLGFDLSEAQVAELREIDKPAIIPLAYEIGRMAAKQQVQPQHFGLDP